VWALREEDAGEREGKKNEIRRKNRIRWKD
jgi:hypothetical protein